MNGRRVPLHLVLFGLTLLSTTAVGAVWCDGRFWGEAQPWWAFVQPSAWRLWLADPRFGQAMATGATYSAALLAILAAHEFGHYFAARRHGADPTLPFFLPLPLPPVGTLGAVIRVRAPIRGSAALFDIGASGPLAGFAVLLIVLMIGLLDHPGAYVAAIHPEGVPWPPEPGTLFLGDNLLFSLVRRAVGADVLPPMSELYHAPLLYAAWVGCLITALNLLPASQLDGGHIVYALLGRKVHARVARLTAGSLVLAGLLGAVALLFELEATGDVLRSVAPGLETMAVRHGWLGWMVWALVLLFALKLDHPPVWPETPLDPRRRLIGWGCLVVLALVLMPTPVHA